eukprot:3165405-Pyramimonas_sp.AAC.1
MHHTRGCGGCAQPAGSGCGVCETMGWWVREVCETTMRDALCAGGCETMRRACGLREGAGPCDGGRCR